MNSETINIEELAKMSGESYMKRAPKLDLPLVRLQGKEGQYISITKDAEGKNQTEYIGDELNGTIVKVRRALVHFTDDERFFTIEHDHPGSITALFAFKNGKSTLLDKGKSSEIRERHKYLKTHQVLYYLKDDGTTIKINVKGASLGSKDEKVGLYDYFNEFKKGEHIFQYKTNIGVRKVTKKGIGDYYAMTFERGDKLDDLTNVANVIKMLSEVFSENEFVDRDVQPKIATSPSDVPPNDTEQTKEDDEISPEKIPF